MPVTEITLFNDQSVPKRVAGNVGFLFECAADGVFPQQFPGASTLEDLIGDFESAKVRAAALARKLLDGEPHLRGLGQLGIFEELVIRELQFGFHLLHLHDWLLQEGVSVCRFTGPSRFAAGLTRLARRQGTNLRIVAPSAPGKAAGSLARSWQRLLTARFSGSVLRAELRQALTRIDPFHRRDLLRRTRRGPAGDLWFYTTAYTFTRIGLLYEPQFPRPLQFLVENPLTGGRPLSETHRAYDSLYQFVTMDMAPSGSEVRAARETLRRHLAAVPVSGPDAEARDLLLVSPFFRSFLARHLPDGLFATALFERWADFVRPAALVTGNPVFEGYALHAARRRGIPTVLLQHGILGDFCQFVDPPADHYVVRGPFWRDFLAPAARARAVVLDPSGAPPISEGTGDARRSILFLTAPYSMQEFWHGTDLDDILCVLLEAAAAARAELVIRVHPLEQIGFYRAKIRKIAADRPADSAVTYSQGSGLDDLLKRSAVAVTFYSTVFLDCLRHGVPVVSFDWHDFSFKRQIAAYGVFNFARCLTELRRLVERGLDGTLKAYPHSTTPFLAGTPAEELRATIKRTVQRSSR